MTAWPSSTPALMTDLSMISAHGKGHATSSCIASHAAYIHHDARPCLHCRCCSSSSTPWQQGLQGLAMSAKQVAGLSLGILACLLLLACP